MCDEKKLRSVKDISRKKYNFDLTVNRADLGGINVNDNRADLGEINANGNRADLVGINAKGLINQFQLKNTCSQLSCQRCLYNIEILLH